MYYEINEPLDDLNIDLTEWYGQFASPFFLTTQGSNYLELLENVLIHVCDQDGGELSTLHLEDHRELREYCTKLIHKIYNASK